MDEQPFVTVVLTVFSDDDLDGIDTKSQAYTLNFVPDNTIPPISTRVYAVQNTSNPRTQLDLTAEFAQIVVPDESELIYKWYRGVYPSTANPLTTEANGKGKQTITDEGLAPGTEYNYWVDITDASGKPVAIKDGLNYLTGKGETAVPLEIKAAGAPDRDGSTGFISAQITGRLPDRSYEVQWYRGTSNAVSTTNGTPRGITPVNSNGMAELTDRDLNSDTPYYYLAVVTETLTSTKAKTGDATSEPIFLATELGGDDLKVIVDGNGNRYYLTMATTDMTEKKINWKIDGGEAADQYNWDVDLPQNVDLDIITIDDQGVLHIKQTAEKSLSAGNYTLRVLAREKNGSKDGTSEAFELIVSPPATGDLKITGAPQTGHTTTGESTVVLTASGGTEPYTWTAYRLTPASDKITFSAADGEIKIAAGAARGLYTANLSVEDKSSPIKRGSGPVYFYVDGDPPPNSTFTVTRTTPDSGLSNLKSSSTIEFKAENGTGTHTWEFVNLPSELNNRIKIAAKSATESNIGVITFQSGMPTGEYRLTVKATDGSTPAKTDESDEFRIGFNVVLTSPSPSPSSSSKLTADSITMTGMPANNTMYVGDKMTLVPTLASGLTRSTSKWEYDTTYFTLSASGETATFTAKKAGTTQILYSLTDTTGTTVTKTINVTILPRVGLPQTGQDDRAATIMLWIGAVLLALAPFAERLKKKLLPLVKRK